mmetsp:Transcript_9126/g.22387  ORF Transcript_9126/g.22387 Transcript_9126/m.22387 type:complete len:226 (-) Transcript_9126:30-707(-)
MDPGNVVFFQPVGEGGLCVPMAVVVRVVLADEGGGVDLVALEPRGEAGRVQFLRVRDPVVPDHREGQHQHLPLVGRIRQGLGVAHHARREHELPGDARVGPERDPAHLGPVLQLERRVPPVGRAAHLADQLGRPSFLEQAAPPASVALKVDAVHVVSSSRGRTPTEARVLTCSACARSGLWSQADGLGGRVWVWLAVRVRRRLHCWWEGKGGEGEVWWAGFRVSG